MLLLKKAEVRYYFSNVRSLLISLIFPRCRRMTQFSGKHSQNAGDFIFIGYKIDVRATKREFRSDRRGELSVVAGYSVTRQFFRRTPIYLSRCVLCSPGSRTLLVQKSSKVKRRLAAGQVPDLQPLTSARRILCVLAARGVTSHCTRRIVSGAQCTEPSPAHTSTYLPIYP